MTYTELLSLWFKGSSGNKEKVILRDREALKILAF